MYYNVRGMTEADAKIAVAKLMRDNTKEQLAADLLDLQQNTVIPANAKTVELPRPEKISIRYGYYAAGNRRFEVSTTMPLPEIDSIIQDQLQIIANVLEMRKKVEQRFNKENKALTDAMVKLTEGDPSPEELAVRLIKAGYVDPADIKADAHTRKNRF